MTDSSETPDLVGKSREVWSKVALSAIEWIGHLVLVILILSGIYLLEWFMKLLWGEGMAFVGVPIEKLFAGANVAVIGGILVFGTINVLRAYVGRHR